MFWSLIILYFWIFVLEKWPFNTCYMDSQVGLRWINKKYVILNENRLRRFLEAQNFVIVRNVFLAWTVSNTSGVLARIRDCRVVYWTPLIRRKIRFIAVLRAEDTIFLHPAYCIIIGMLCAGAKFICTWLATESFFS